MGKKRKNVTEYLNDVTFKLNEDKYHLIALNQFKWNNLPTGITETHLERLLYRFGKAIFFKNPKGSFMCLEAQDGEGMNVYGMPTSYRAIGYNFNKKFNVDDCVIIENNKLRLPTQPFIRFYAGKLTEIERTADVNVKACKTPVIFACDDKDVLTFKQIFQKVDGNVPAIFADRGLNIDAISAYDTKVKFLGNELADYKKTVENELLTFLGQNNPAVDKRERLLTDEVNSNNELIESFFDLQLEARKRACEEINTLFNLSISVEPRHKLEEPKEVKTDDL